MATTQFLKIMTKRWFVREKLAVN